MANVSFLMFAIALWITLERIARKELFTLVTVSGQMTLWRCALVTAIVPCPMFVNVWMDTLVMSVMFLSASQLQSWIPQFAVVMEAVICPTLVSVTKTIPETCVTFHFALESMAQMHQCAILRDGVSLQMFVNAMFNMQEKLVQFQSVMA